MTGTRDPADTVRAFLRDAEYFDSEDGADAYVQAVRALDALVAQLERCRSELVEQINQYEKTERLMYHYQSLLGDRGLL